MNPADHKDSVYSAQKFLDSIVENIPDMIFVKDAKDLRFVRFNKAGEKLLGFDRKDLIGKSDIDFFPPEEANFFIKKDREVLMSGKLHDIPEEVIHTKNGSRMLHTKKIPIFDENGTPQYLLGISEDITERQLLEGRLQQYMQDLEKKVRERTAKLQEEVVKDKALIESIGEGFIAVDIDQKIIVINKLAEKILGKDGVQMIGTDISDVLMLENEKGERVPFKDSPVALTLDSGLQNSSSDLFYVRSKGNRFPAYSTASPIILKDKIIGAILVFRDITKEKEIDHAKDEFITLVSHELRTPLTIASWYTKRYLTSGDTMGIDQQKSYLNEIVGAVERMVDLVNAILEISKIELGRTEIKLSEFDLAIFSDQIISELSEDIKKKHIKVHKIYTGDLNKVYLDKKVMTILLHNLYTNAIRYNREGGEINISLTKDESGISIDVKDSGYGIPVSEQEKIFTKLYRATNAREKVPDGTGLGLYITKQFVDRAGGRIWFESEEGSGSLFHTVLPQGSV